MTSVEHSLVIETHVACACNLKTILDKMPSCVFRKCTNYTASVKDTTGVSFHSLPRDRIMKEKWVNVIRQQRLEYDWMPTHYTTICSKHFDPDDMYVTGKNIRRLKKTAVPFIKGKDDYMFYPSNLVEVNINEEEPKKQTDRASYLTSKIRRVTLANKKLKSKNSKLVCRNNKLAKKFNDLIKIVHQLKRKLATCECNKK